MPNPAHVENSEVGHEQAWKEHEGTCVGFGFRLGFRALLLPDVGDERCAGSFAS